MTNESNDFWAARRSRLAPTPEISQAAGLLQQASIAHRAGDMAGAADFIRRADIPALAVWADTLWSSLKPGIHRWREVPNLPLLIERHERHGARMPTAEVKRQLAARDGYHCRYCGIPVIRQEVRERIRKLYPDALRWGPRNRDQHTAFQCMWLAYEHVMPHCRGGDNSVENMIISCWPCNGGKVQYTLEELGLIDPRRFPPIISDWKGLEDFGG